MVWNWNGLGPLIVCELRGLELRNLLKFLSEGLLSFVDDLLGAEDENTIRIRWSGDLIFIQDGAPYHKALDTMRFLEESDLPPSYEFAEAIS